MKKLYVVTATYYVAADSEGEAEMVTPDVTASDVSAEEVESAADIDPAWWDAFPFGGDENLACKDYFEEETPASSSSEAFPDPLFPME